MRTIKETLHEKRRTTEKHIQQLQREGNQGVRYTAMMPDIPFLMLGLISDVGWMIHLIAGVIYFCRNGFGFLDFFARFLMVLYAMEIYDIFFFDWVLLCHSSFFPHFYPELKGVVGPHMFGYNKRTHIRHFAVYIPASAAAAWLCTML